MDYVDPKTKHVFRNVPVRQGPESVVLEQIRLPFWYGGPQYEIVEAGFGPYALSRLATATGGIYFVTRFDTRRMGFDPARMREYRPDWVPRDEYEKEVNRSSLRQAVLTAAQITQQKLPGMPTLYFPAADGPEFKDTMSTNQAVAERTAYTVDEALGPINSVAKLRDRETSRRWQAHYDLIRGRLLAMKVRCYEYNWACARMKKDPPKFSNSKSNAWRLVPTRQSSIVKRRRPPAGRPNRSCTGSSTIIRRPLGPCSPARAGKPARFQVDGDLCALPVPELITKRSRRQKNKNMNQPPSRRKFPNYSLASWCGSTGWRHRVKFFGDSGYERAKSRCSAIASRGSAVFRWESVSARHSLRDGERKLWNCALLLHYRTMTFIISRRPRRPVVPDRTSGSQEARAWVSTSLSPPRSRAQDDDLRPRRRLSHGSGWQFRTGAAAADCRWRPRARGQEAGEHRMRGASPDSCSHGGRPPRQGDPAASAGPQARPGCAAGGASRPVCVT